jgi:hypothetical protein
MSISDVIWADVSKCSTEYFILFKCVVEAANKRFPSLTYQRQTDGQSNLNRYFTRMPSNVTRQANNKMKLYM